MSLLKQGGGRKIQPSRHSVKAEEELKIPVALSLNWRKCEQLVDLRHRVNVERTLSTQWNPFVKCTECWPGAYPGQRQEEKSAWMYISSTGIVVSKSLNVLIKSLHP